MQGKEIPDALAARALSVSNAGGVKGISCANAIPRPESTCLILTSPPKQKAKARRLPSVPPVKTRTILALKAAERPGKQISLAPVPARARAVSHGHRQWHLEMERTAAGTSCQGKVASVRSAAACLDWRVTEHVSGTEGFYTFLTFCFSAQLLGCCFNHPATTVLDHWCFEIVFVARKIVYHCCRESSASNLVDEKRSALHSNILVWHVIVWIYFPQCKLGSFQEREPQYLI